MVSLFTEGLTRLFLFMEILTLNRRIFTDKSTIGDLFYRGEPFSQTIELSCRRGDEKGLLAIPAGRYRIELLPSPKFKRILPRLIEVPNRKGILIHPANRAEELDGCIAPGLYNENIPNFVCSSRKTFDSLFEKLRKETDDIFITITGGLR